MRARNSILSASHSEIGTPDLVDLAARHVAGPARHLGESHDSPAPLLRLRITASGR